MAEALQVEMWLGDCLEVMPRLAAGSVDMVFADLPYGVTKYSYDKKIPFVAFWQALQDICFDRTAYIFSATYRFGIALCSSNLRIYRYDLVWQKSRPTGFLSAKKAPLRAHEQIHVFYQNQPTYNPQMTDAGRPFNNSSKQRRDTNRVHGGVYGKHTGVASRRSNLRYPISVQRILSVNSNGNAHPAQKPVALLEWLIRTYTNAGDTVLDPVSGSATTAIAAIRTGRNVVCIEKDPTYFAAGVERVRAEITASGVNADLVVHG